MKIGIVAHYLGPRLGIGQYIEGLLPPLLRQCADRKLAFVVFASPNAIQQTPGLRLAGDAVIPLPALDYSAMRRWIWVAGSLNALCKKHGVDKLLWLSNPIIFPWHCSSIAVLHDVNEWKAKKKYGSRIRTVLRAVVYLEFSLRFGNIIVAVSNAGAKELLQFRPGARHKIRIIPNGMDTHLSKLVSGVVEVPKEPIILSVGRIDPVAKRLEDALSLVGALRNTSGEHWNLYFVGGMNESSRQVGEKFLKKISTFGWVKYLGHISDEQLAAWYRCAAAVVFLSDNEGFGLPISEAAAFGKLVIVSKLNVVASESGGDNLIVVDPEDSEEAARIVLREFSYRRGAASAIPQTWAKAAVMYADLLEE